MGFSIDLSKFTTEVCAKFKAAGINNDAQAQDVAKTIFDGVNSSDVADKNTQALNRTEYQTANEQIDARIQELKKENEELKNAEKPSMDLEENMSGIETGSAIVYKGQNGIVFAINNALYLEENAKKALEYYRKNGSLDGFVESEDLKDLRLQGFKIDYEIQTQWDDKSNDDSVLVSDGKGGYTAEIVEKSDGVLIRIKSTHPQNDNVVQFGTARDHASGDEERRKQYQE